MKRVLEVVFSIAVTIILIKAIAGLAAQHSPVDRPNECCAKKGSPTECGPCPK